MSLPAVHSEAVGWLGSTEGSPQLDASSAGGSQSLDPSHPFLVIRLVIRDL
ncbi:MAG: hypothetical protein IT428_05040 [Planctomycetaceae bacterium]|nr:hypothetical protein [Planctomycetaceae bacterium]